MRNYLYIISFLLLSVSSVFAEFTRCTEIPEDGTVCLEVMDIDSEFGTVTIGYATAHDIYGFQFNVTGLSIESYESDLDIYYSAGTDFFIVRRF